MVSDPVHEHNITTGCTNYMDLSFVIWVKVLMVSQVMLIISYMEHGRCNLSPSYDTYTNFESLVFKDLHFKEHFLGLGCSSVEKCLVSMYKAPVWSPATWKVGSGEEEEEEEEDNSSSEELLLPLDELTWVDSGTLLSGSVVETIRLYLGIQIGMILSHLHIEICHICTVGPPYIQVLHLQIEVILDQKFCGKRTLCL